MEPPTDVADSSANKNVTIIKVKPAGSDTQETALLHLIPVAAAKPMVAVIATPAEKIEEGEGEAANVHKNLAIIQEAQKAVRRLDLLVCGTCHKTFHFIEEFTEHKTDATCTKPSYRTNINESKPQVWAFLLWKANVGSRLMATEPDSTSWGLYKRWCKLSQQERDTWIAAGRAIQVCTTLGAATIRQVTTEQKKLVSDGEHLLFTDTIKQEKAAAVTVVKRKVGRPRLNPIDSVTEASDEKPTVKLTRRAALAAGLNINPNKDANTMKPKAMRTRALRERKAGDEEGASSEEENYVVEKILAKRFNPKAKQYEYLLKWEGYPQDQNTWEPVDHMESCDKLVETFERNLAKQKANQAKAAHQGRVGVGSPHHKVVTKVVKLPAKLDVSQPGPSGESSGRPVRSSKTKAMENVKSWCGSIGKRKGADDQESDSDGESGTKRVKIEQDSSSDEDYEDRTPGLLKSLSLVKSTHQKPVNGVKKVDGSSPPVLVANSKGVVKVDPKQVANLTSGVYIVSNQAGVVKLGAGGSPKKPTEEAAGGGQTKLLPKGSPKPSGLIRMASPAQQRKTLLPRIPLLSTPRTPSPKLLGPRPSLSTLAARPGLRQPFIPRPPTVLRPPRGSPALAPRGSPAAQVKRGVRPIQAMLGGSSAAAILTVKLPRKKAADTGKSKQLRTKLLPAPQADAKSNKTTAESLLMDFHESESEEEATLPLEEECPAPSPPGSPLPLTLCPETGKILGQAEGEPTPQSTPEEDGVEGGGEDITVTRLADHVTAVEGVGGSAEYVTITGEDGVVYHIATDGENLVEGDTMLMSSDGQQQCVYVTSDAAPPATGGGSGATLTLDTAVAEAVAQMGEGGRGSQIVMTNAGEAGGLVVMTTGEDGENSTQAQVVAQIVEEGEPQPGGMRKVVLLLPDGNFMMTEVDEEQYAALDLGK